MGATLSSVPMERILITGAAGYLAWSLINLLRDMDCQIVRLGRPGTKFVPLTGFAKVTDVTGDIREGILPPIFEPVSRLI